MTLEEFCSIKHFQNMYSKYLWGTNIGNFDFVGIVENFENSLKIFKKKFKINPLADIEKTNINPQKTSYNYNLTKSLRNFIYKTNLKDYEIYEYGLRINKQLEKIYLF